MKSRLLDRFLLADVRNTARSVELISAVTGKISAEMELAFTRSYALLAPSEDGWARAFALDITLAIVAKNPEATEDPVLFRGSVRMKARFEAADETRISDALLSEQVHSFTRFVYPLARLELFRLLAGAKLQDRALPWDIGPGSDAIAESVAEDALESNLQSR